MSLIDSTYFKDEILIAGVANTVDSTNSKILGFINKYEAKYLKELLGKTLYDEFIAGLQENPIDDKWIALRDALVDSDLKQSPISNYVYYWYMRNKATETVGLGEISSKTESGSMASSVDKQTRAWNEMVDWNKDVIKFITDNISDYPNYKPEHSYYVNGLYGHYYPCYKPELLRYINSLGL